MDKGEGRDMTKKASFALRRLVELDFDIRISNKPSYTTKKRTRKKKVKKQGEV